MIDPLRTPGNECAPKVIRRGGHFLACSDYH